MMKLDCYKVLYKLRMRALNVVAGLPPEGGISYSVPELCRCLARLSNIDVDLVSTGKEISHAAHLARINGVNLVICKPSFPLALYFSWKFLFKLPSLVDSADLVHVHSNWTFPVWWACCLAIRYDKPLMMTPRGCLAPERLKISAFKKRMVGWLFDRGYLQRATVIHATCQREAEDVKEYLGGSQLRKGEHFKDEAVTAVLSNELGQPRIEVVPNGVDLDVFDSVTADRKFVDLRWPEIKGKRVALFLSRIHPLKNLENIICAWAAVCKDMGSLKVLKYESDKVFKEEGASAGVRDCERARVEDASGAAGLVTHFTFHIPHSTVTAGCVLSDWILLIAGSGDEKYVQSLKQQVEQGGLAENIKFIGSVFGDEKVKLLKAAEFLVLPTKNENFGIVIAEALACGVPVITTKGAPWAELVEYRCGWWVDVSVEPLTQALREAMGLTDEERRVMGANGRKLVEAKYQWSAVAQQMMHVYERMLAVVHKR